MRAVRRIQKIIPVTRPTASTLSSPPTASCARLDSTLVEKVSTAAKLPDTITAPSTPSQTARTRRRLGPRRRGHLAQRSQQDADDQARLEALAQPDQQIRNRVSPAHAE